MALEDILPTSFFYANDPPANLALRQRIALQMMQGNKKAYPKTFGEGLSAIGDALGEIGMARRLQQEDVEYQKGAKKGAATLDVTAPEAPARRTAATSYAPSDDSEATPAPQADIPPPAMRSVAPMVTVPADTPVRTNPDGTIAGNMTSPTTPPETAAAEDVPLPRPRPTDAPVPEPPPAPPGVDPEKFRQSFIKAYPERLAQAIEAQRNNIAAAAMPTAQAVPQQNPILAGQVPRALTPPQPTAPSPGSPTDPRLALAVPPGVASDAPAVLPPQITGAPRPPLIAPAPPPMQVAQNNAAPLTPQQVGRMPVPPADFSYVQPGMRPPVPPQQTPQTSRERDAQQMKDDNQGNPYMQQRMQTIIQEEQAKRLYVDQQNKAQYDSDIQAFREMVAKRQEQIATQASRGTEGIKSTAEATKEAASVSPALNAAELARRTGMPADQAQQRFDSLKTTATKDVFTLQQLSLARDALNRGVVSGAGANMKLNIERYKAWLASDPRAAALASNSEQFLAAMKSTISNALQNVQPGDTRVTNADQLLAMGMVGGDITNQLATQRKLIDISTENVRKRLGEYEDLKDHYLSGLPIERMYDVQTNPLHPNPAVEKAWVDKLLKLQDNPAAITQFNQEFGPGAAELEIARARRRSRRLGVQ